VHERELIAVEDDHGPNGIHAEQVDERFDDHRIVAELGRLPQLA
jgi:hypothetical protein